jgi:hypothetical protein
LRKVIDHVLQVTVPGSRLRKVLDQVLHDTRNQWWKVLDWALGKIRNAHAVNITVETG